MKQLVLCILTVAVLLVGCSALNQTTELTLIQQAAEQGTIIELKQNPAYLPYFVIADTELTALLATGTPVTFAAVQGVISDLKTKGDNGEGYVVALGIQDVMTLVNSYVGGSTNSITPYVFALQNGIDRGLSAVPPVAPTPITVTNAPLVARSVAPVSWFKAGMAATKH